MHGCYGLCPLLCSKYLCYLMVSNLLLIQYVLSFFLPLVSAVMIFIFLFPHLLVGAEIHDQMTVKTVPVKKCNEIDVIEAYWWNRQIDQNNQINLWHHPVEPLSLAGWLDQQMQSTDGTSPDGIDRWNQSQWNWPLKPVPMELTDGTSPNGIDR